MLKKLFVHEWKATWRLPSLLNVVVLSLTLIGCLLLRNRIWETTTTSALMTTTYVLYIIIYIASIIALGFSTSYYFWMRFFKNLYTDQGYLMHTLPVTANELIWSKFFVNAIWNIIGAVVQASSILTLLHTALGIFDGFSLKALFEEFRFSDLTGNEMGQFICFILFIFITCVAGFVMNIFMGYASVSIGQLFKKRKIGGAILIYIGFYMAFQMVSSYIIIPSTAFVERAETAWPVILILGISALVAAGAATAFYFITYYMMTQKLNLE